MRKRQRDKPGRKGADRRPYVISTPRELKAMGTPLRQEILAALEDSEGSSVAELARAVGRSPQSLYYHLRALVSAGLLEVKETRATGKRPSAIYSCVRRAVLIDQSSRSKRFLDSLADMYGATIRLTERELRAGLEADRERPKSEPRRTGVLVLQSRLSSEGIAELRQRLLELGRFMEASDEEDGEGTSVTIAFRPSGLNR